MIQGNLPIALCLSMFVNITTNATIFYISQELTKGVKSSMSIVHTADAQLRQRIPPALPGDLRFDGTNFWDNLSNHILRFCLILLRIRAEDV